MEEGDEDEEVFPITEFPLFNLTPVSSKTEKAKMPRFVKPKRSHKPTESGVRSFVPLEDGSIAETPVSTLAVTQDVEAGDEEQQCVVCDPGEEMGTKGWMKKMKKGRGTQKR